MATVTDALGVASSVGGYSVTRVIGRGPCGTVCLAEHPEHDKPVALKVLEPDLAGAAAFRERFLADCRIAATLDHTAAVPIFDAEQVGDVLYVARKYVDGSDLATLLRDGPLSHEQTWSIVEQVAGALHAAHREGLVHRDLKPSNILVESDTQRVYVTDFGMAPRVRDYAAPEQTEGSVDGRADIYSLGLVLAACLEDAPRDLQVVVDRATAKDPADRYTTALELAEACRGSLAPRPVAPPPVRAEPAQAPEPPRRRRTRIALAAAALLAVGVVAALVLTRGSGHEPAETATLQAVRPLLATKLREDLVPSQQTLTDRVRTGDLRSIETAARATADEVKRIQHWMTTLDPAGSDRAVFSAFARAVNAHAGYAASLANLAPASSITKAEAQDVIASATRAERAYRQLHRAGPQLPTMPLRRRDQVWLLTFVPQAVLYDEVAFSGGEGVRYRSSPAQWCGGAPPSDPCWKSVVPGLGAAEGHWLRIYCYTSGAGVHGNTWWAKVRFEPAEYVPATFLRKGHNGRPAGMPAC